MKMVKLTVVALACISKAVAAQDFKPYPTPKITETQWGAYYDEVRQAHGRTEKRADAQRLVTYNDSESRMSFAFTLPGHPAHPAWITRQLVEYKDGIYMDQIGYFAGEEKLFAELFDQYRRLNEKLEAKFKANRRK